MQPEMISFHVSCNLGHEVPPITNGCMRCTRDTFLVSVPCLAMKTGGKCIITALVATENLAAHRSHARDLYTITYTSAKDV